MAKNKHGEAVEAALEESGAPQDAFTLSEDELALAAIFDDTDEDMPTPSGIEESGHAEEASPAEPEGAAESAEEDEPQAPEPSAEEPSPDESSQGDTPSLDLTSEVKRTPEPTTRKDDEVSSEELAKKRAKWRKDATEKLEQHFASQLSDEDKDLLLSEPERVLPRILAHSYLDMYDSLMAGMGQQMPTQVAQMLEAQKVAQQAEQQFFSQWPQLKEAVKDSPVKADLLQRTVQTYRNMNPEVPMEQAIAEAGAMAMVALKIPLETPSGGKPPTEKPFVPATPGGSRAAQPPKPKPLNEFQQLANEMLEDDL